MNNSVSLFQHDNEVGPAKSLLAAGIDNALGEGIRASYAVVGIKAGKFRVKYRGTEHVIQKTDPDTGQPTPVSNLEVVIVKANPFLNKQYYAGKYAEGSNSPPDCYSLDGKVPSAQVAKPVHNSCTLCPKNQFGSLVSDTGVKQKACRDTKKLAIVPLGDLRNEAMGGPMLFRVPPSALKDLSNLADAMKSRGYPYNSVAVRISFDLDASHPKPTFNAIRPLKDAEAQIVLELFHGDGVAAVLSDNDAVLDVAVAPVENPAARFEQEPAHVPAGTNLESAAAPQAAPPPPKTLQPSTALQAPQAPQAEPSPTPPTNGFSAPTQMFQPPRGPGRPRKVQAEQPQAVAAPAPVLVEPTPEPTGSAIDEDVNSILASLNSFTSGH